MGEQLGCALHEAMDGLPLERWKCLHTLHLIRAFTGYIEEEKALLATCRDRMMVEYEAHQRNITSLRESLDKAPDEHARRQAQKALDAAIRHSANTYDKLTLEGRKRTHQRRIDRYEAEVRRLWAAWGELHGKQDETRAAGAVLR